MLGATWLLLLKKFAAVAVTVLLLSVRARSSTETVLYSFTGSDGGQPYAGLISDSSGNLYGTTETGGAYKSGTVFELTPNSRGGWTETVLYSFCAATSCSDGADPRGGLVRDAAGNLFGTTFEGRGSNCGQDYYGCGVVFELSPNDGSWTETVLYSFSAGRDGANPYGGLVFDSAGNLYGTTSYGGDKNCLCGTVFELSPGSSAWTQTVIHTFRPNSGDGAYPYAGLAVDAANNLYGTTNTGGVYGRGSVFKLTPKADKHWSFTLLHSFFDSRGGREGFEPQGPVLLDSKGSIYGTTEDGGTQYYGTVFKLTPLKGGKWKEAVLHTFDDSDGAYPSSSVILDQAGTLYGTTQAGGVKGVGTVFKLAPSKKGWAETVLYSFCTVTGCSDGDTPRSGLIADQAGNLYGTASGGGNGYGVVFEVVP